MAAKTKEDVAVEREMLNDENEQRKSEGRPELDFFEQAGIDIAGLRGKWVRLNVGKMKLEGKVVSVNEQYGLLKIKGKDGYMTIVRLGKVSMISVKD